MHAVHTLSYVNSKTMIEAIARVRRNTITPAANGMKINWNRSNVFSTFNTFKTHQHITAKSNVVHITERIKSRFFFH